MYRINESFWIIDYQNDSCIWRAIFEYLEECILGFKTSGFKMIEYCNTLAFIWLDTEIPYTLTYGRNAEFFFVLSYLIESDSWKISFSAGF